MENIHFDPNELDIANNIVDNIRNGSLMNRNMASIDRITQIYFSKNHNNSHQEEQVIDFLFECLDRYGSDASILFRHVVNSKKVNDIIKRLHDDYEGVFEWNMVNHCLFENTNSLVSANKHMKIIIFIISTLLICFSIYMYLHVNKLNALIKDDENRMKKLNKSMTKLQEKNALLTKEYNEQIDSNKKHKEEKKALVQKLNDRCKTSNEMQIQLSLNKEIINQKDMLLQKLTEKVANCKYEQKQISCEMSQQIPKIKKQKKFSLKHAIVLFIFLNQYIAVDEAKELPNDDVKIAKAILIIQFFFLLFFNSTYFCISVFSFFLSFTLGAFFAQFQEMNINKSTKNIFSCVCLAEVYKFLVLSHII
ncbi:hypothetical protein M9Y10_041789 [Tritrichomonas musculus]|uniref:Uncharacterized protein n=1 Tax=Tritrichomonas musculus TaxID=1915356 RepID=A0ABR2K5C5_9EUKA